MKTTLFTAALALASAAAQPAPVCSARSPAHATPVVELYTSEGCSSCPPADRWLSRFKSDASVVALAFHVDYWDRLGWTDRFASAAFTQRQSEQQRSSGARFSYTPQVLVDGRDRPDWPSAPVAPSVRPATVQAQLVRSGHHVSASVLTLAGAPPRLAGYWAVTENDHASAVRAGENAGATLHHDFVVREYRPIAPWPTTAQAARLEFDLVDGGEDGHPRTVNLVITDADSGRPVQAVRLGC